MHFAVMAMALLVAVASWFSPLSSAKMSPASNSTPQVSTHTPLIQHVVKHAPLNTANRYRTNDANLRSELITQGYQIDQLNPHSEGLDITRQRRLTTLTHDLWDIAVVTTREGAVLHTSLTRYEKPRERGDQQYLPRFDSDQPNTVQNKELVVVTEVLDPVDEPTDEEWNTYAGEDKSDPPLEPISEPTLSELNDPSFVRPVAVQIEPQEKKRFIRFRRPTTDAVVERRDESKNLDKVLDLETASTLSASDVPSVVDSCLVLEGDTIRAALLDWLSCRGIQDLWVIEPARMGEPSDFLMEVPITLPQGTSVEDLATLVKNTYKITLRQRP